MEAPLKEGLLMLGGPWVPFSELTCSDGLQQCDSLPRPRNPLPVAGRAVQQALKRSASILGGAAVRW